MEQETVESSCVRVREATRDVAILKAKLAAIEGWRDHEILTLRTAGREAVDSLKVCRAVGVLRYLCTAVAITLRRTTPRKRVKPSSYGSLQQGLNARVEKTVLRDIKENTSKRPAGAPRCA